MTPITIFQHNNVYRHSSEFVTTTLSAETYATTDVTSSAADTSITAG